ncbi:coumaroyl-CoA:anthocyanidin 3-O-glucoside-6''-O-coumaroyltransferase 1-like [Carex rostrata]
MSPGITPNYASLRFTFFDLIMLNFTPVYRLLFYSYQHPTMHFLYSHLPSLKCSLSVTLVTYYPLVGGYRKKPDTDNVFEHYYKEGNGLSFTVEECVDGQFEDLANYHEREVSQLDYVAPLLLKSRDDEESKPYDGIVVAAEAIGKSIEQISEILLKSPLNWKPIADMPVLDLARSRKFRAYDIDFGLGRSTKVEVISANKVASRSVLDFQRTRWIASRSVSQMA